MYYWDGRGWVSTLSPDGRFRWDGSTWTPVAAMAPATPYWTPKPQRVPTSWTKPLQYAVIARYAAAGVYGIFLPFWLGGYMSRVMQASLQRQSQAYPPGEAPPTAFTDMMTSVMTTSIWIGVVVGVALSAVAIVAAIKRWTWAFYAILVLIGFTLLGTIYSVVNLALGGLLTANQPQPPVATQVFELAFGLVDTALFIWMLVAVIRRGPWAMVWPTASRDLRR
jgi:hypothetical protein